MDIIRRGTELNFVDDNGDPGVDCAGDELNTLDICDIELALEYDDIEASEENINRIIDLISEDIEDENEFANPNVISLIDRAVEVFKEQEDMD